MATILLAGGTGMLGALMADALIRRGATVRAIVRPGTEETRISALRARGAQIVAADLSDAAALTGACQGVDCVISTLSGLEDTIVDGQTTLLAAAVAAGVPRFIPSDFAADFTKLRDGENRNFDLRRRFMARLDAAPIRATSILNGGFMDMLGGQMPVILSPIRRIAYWQDADQPLDFTTMANTVDYTAAATLDPDTPRFLRIAGEVASARDLARIVSEVKGHRFRLLRAGGLKRLEWLIRTTRRLFPQPGAVFPAWQGMQYLHNMFSGRAKLTPLDNNRYPDVRWTSIAEVLRKA